MSNMVMNQTHVGCLVSRLALGKGYHQFQSEIESYLNNNGLEWTVNRQKALWTAANHLRNGDREAARSVYQENSIAYHKGSMLPKGAYKPVVRGYVEAQRPSVIRRAAAPLRFYTTLVNPSLTEKQSAKALRSITQGTSARVPDGFSRFAETFGRALARLPARKSRGKIENRSPSDPRLLRPNTYTYSRVRLSRRDRGVPLRSMAMSLLTESYIPSTLGYTDPFPLLTRSVREPVGFVGRIGVIQEQGAKARVVAMPTARVQMAFHPLHGYLAWIGELLPTSVVGDQQKAIYGLLDFMQDYPAHSTDLSAATDRFPIGPQLSLLRGLGLPEYEEALKEVTSMSWDSPWGPVKYAVGQPMGLYGSFPLFNLSNQMTAAYATLVEYGSSPGNIPVLEYLLRHVAHEFPQCGIPPAQPGREPRTFPNGECFYVLGDDIVFSDIKVRDRYVSLCEQMGIEISQSKSFSGHLTEFAGFVLTRAQGKPFAFRPYKPPSASKSSGNITNPIDFLAAMGIKAARLSKYWDKQYQLFSRTWSDRSPDLTPWIRSLEEDTGIPKWELRTLENEWNYLRGSYPPTALPDLNPNIRYSENLIFSEDPNDTGFRIIGRGSDGPRDPSGLVKPATREDLANVAKHPMRTAKVLSSDPLMRRERERLVTSSQEDGEPKGVSSRRNSRRPKSHKSTTSVDDKSPVSRRRQVPDIIEWDQDKDRSLDLGL